MKAVVATTYSNTYLFFLPIITFLWNKLNVDVICFAPPITTKVSDKFQLIENVILNNTKGLYLYTFFCPEHKEATYAQCSRLYAACLDLPEDEVLITSDIDMGVFGEYLKQKTTDIDIFGGDLVPERQSPMCYISASVKHWRQLMNIDNKDYQQCLDELVGVIECQDFRGNQWSLDQDSAYRHISATTLGVYHHFRARPQTQFANNRVDRDDSFWEERLNLDVIDAHLWRPGYTEENFGKIIRLLSFFYPSENFQWLHDYKNEYVKLL